MARDARAPGTARLWAEVTVLFVGVPLLMAAFFGQYNLLQVVFALAIVAVALLAVTPGFRWSELLVRPGPGALAFGAAAIVATGIACVALALLLVPEQFLAFPRQRPELWLAVMVLYPLASALPQELIYRPLFFRRYGQLFPSERWALAANAVAFGLGHLSYQNPVTILTTVVAGAIFGAAYLRTGSFVFAVILHAVAGQLVFTSGLGIFFYHGAVGSAP